MAVPATFDELINQAEALALYPKLILQINKDFLLANIDLDFEEDILPSSLKFMLQETVFKLITNRFADYLNLLYIIDVSEEKIRALDGSDTLKLSEKVSFMILQREWQKVWFRHKYTS